MNPKQAIINLIIRLADNAFILGHRNSEWTGIGPSIEEDISFSSMAQDKIGHAFQLYTILHRYMGGMNPDEYGFNRKEKEFQCCHLVELYTEDYGFALVRHFLFDEAEMIRYQSLSQSSFKPLADLAKKIVGEIRYHRLHADVWMKKLAQSGSEESKARMQTALNFLWPYALGIFESSDMESVLMDNNTFVGEDEIRKQWEIEVKEKLMEYNLVIPNDAQPIFGGARGFHTPELADLLLEMQEVYSIDVNAEW